MNKYFYKVAGKNFYCDEKGVLTKDEEDNFEEVAEDDLEELEEVETAEPSEEVENMFRQARAKVKEDAEKDMGDAQIKAVKSIEDLMNKIAEVSNGASSKVGTGKEVRASFDVERVTKGIKDLASKNRGEFSFEIQNVKELNAFLKSTSESGSLTGDVIEPDRVTELTRDPVRQVFIEGISDVTSNMSSNALSYVEAVSESGAPLPTAELATIPQKDWTFQEFKANLKKIAVINKHSVEILQDAPQLVSALKGWLQEDVNIVVDDQLLNGNGTGDNLDGIFNVAEVLDATEVGTKRVADANLYDVIRVAMTKIAVNGKGKFMANYILLNPEDADVLDLTKDADGRYILPPFRSADGNLIKGARVIENVGITEGEFLVGDFRKLHIGTKGGVQIEMSNSDGDDFSNDILSVKIRRRIASYLRQNDSGAFWTGTIADVISALTAS